MSHWPQVICTTIAIYAAAVVVPGPNFLIVTRIAVGASRRVALAAAFGVAIASGLFAVLSVSGLSLILESFSWLHTAIDVAGGAYLAYLGLSTWRHSHNDVWQRKHVALRLTGSQAWARGFFTNISNPKSIAFFVGLFAASLTTNTPHWVKVTLVVSVFCVSAGWYTVVVLCFSRTLVQTHFARMKRIADRLVGGLLVVVGIKLLFEGGRRALP